MVYTSTFSFSRMSFLFFWIALLAFPFYGIAQSPGGVSGDVAWYKGNSGTTLNGSNVSQWNDNSGGGNNAIQATAANQPGYQTNSINFNPALTFNGTSSNRYLNTSATGFPAGNAPRSVFFVATAINSLTTYGWIFGYGTSSSCRAFAVGKTSTNASPLYATGYNNCDATTMGYNFWTQNATKLGRVSYQNPTVSFFDAGTSVGTAVQASWDTLLGTGRIGAPPYSTTENWGGNVAEIIMYPSVLSAADAVKVESYLAVKYGINNTGNYISSTGAIVWDATANVLYDNDVFGIGQDNGSGLSQSQSNSTNTGSGDGTGQSGKGNIIISNPSSLANNGFLMVGHDIGSLTEANFTILGKPTKRVQRIWKVQSTGNPGTVSLSYDKTGLTYSGQNAIDYVLLVDPTGLGNFDGGSVVKYTATAIAGNKISFDTVSLPTGAVFTFQTLGVPTAQATDIVFSGTTSTGTTASWTNGDGSSRVVFIHTGTTGSPLPIDLTTYTANPSFGGGTQIGLTGWYCVYKGTGTTVNISGLIPATSYQVMTLEYNGTTPSNEIYLTTVSTDNPATITTNTTSSTLVGPGGAITGLQLWLDASNGIAASGGNLTAWTDRTAINTFAVSATPPTVNSNAINFHPTVAFNNTTPINTYPATQNLIGNTSITYVDAYAVFKVNNTSGGTVIGSTLQGNSYGRAVFSGSTSRMYAGNGNSSNFAFFPYADITNFHVFAMEKNTASTTVARLDANNQVVTNQGNYSSISFIPTIGTTNNNSNTGGWPHLNGQIAEVVTYSQSAGLQKINIESYLALKYGIHKIDNYVSSANTIVWDATLNALYDNDVFGIGIDDLSGLSQSISNSMSTGSGDGTGQSGKGNIVISNPTALANNEFLVIGHNVEALAETDIIFAGNHSKRVQRIWKAQATGNPGNVTLSYDTTGLSYSGQSASDYVLLVDPTGLGVFDGGSVVKYTAALLTGNKVTFNAVALPTGAVFTFQTLATPTVQATNVVFSGTTATTTTASWTKGSGSSRAVFMFAGTTGSALPIDLTAYTPNTVFGSGTQIGTTGWYCVYNGTGTTVNITGLTPVTTYQLMTVEYTGLIASQLYLSTISTGNPAGVTTLNNVATLNNLTISQGILDPTFATATTIYTANVANAVSSLTVTPTATDTNAMITVNGEIVISGNPSEAIPLAVGPNIITTIVTAQDGITLKTYTITINRTAPATIVTTGTVSPLSTVYGTASASGTFNVSGTDMLAGILVTAPSGFEVSTDNLTFTNTVTVGATGIIGSTPVYIRLKGNIPAGSYLGDVALSSAGATTVNFAIVSSTVTKAELTIAANNQTKVYGTVNPTLTVSYLGFVNGDAAASLTTAPTIETTAVTGSAPGTYPITASAAVSSNYTFNYVPGTLTVTPLAIATLSGLTISQGTLTPVFATGTTIYTATVPNTIANITVTPTTTDATATVTVNGTAVVSGNSSGAIALVVGTNVINVVVTAQDGTTIETYTITVTKAAAPPIITNFSPQTGAVGTTVVITGANYGATIAENIVFFGATKATVTAASTTSITVTVPVGATYQPISVLNTISVLSGSSNTSFITSFDPNKGRLTIDDIMPKVDFTTVSSAGSDIAMGDFDGDGKIDLALLNSINGPGGAVLVFHNTSSSGSITNASFTDGGSFSVGRQPQGIAVADLDGDGKLDLAITNRSSGTISVLRNTSSGVGNINFDTQITYTTGTGSIGIVIYDFDNDGKADIINANYGLPSLISVFKNISSGINNINFAPATFISSGRIARIELGDFDNDKKMDFLVTNYNDGTVSVFRNTSVNEVISFSPPVTFSAAVLANDISVGDLNNDGKVDIAIGNEDLNSIYVVRNISSGVGNINFDTNITLTTNAAFNRTAISDIDGDGKLDIIVGSNNSSLSIFRNTSSVGGALTFENKVDFVNGATTAALIIADLDGDGKNDIADLNNNNLSIFRNNPLFPPTVQSTNVVFTATTGTSTTASWTNGNGSSRAVFMYAGTSGSPLPVNYIPYTANAAFGTGDQIGISGWYCVYYGTGTSANITGLNPATTYQVMVVERNGSATDELYLPTVSTGNPAGVTTLSNVATLSNLTISQGILSPVFTTGTITYTATVANAVTSLIITPTTTDTNATVKVNGTTVVSGNASGVINLAVGPNVITTIVTAQDGTTISTYTITVNRTAPATIVTTGTVSALSTVYGTPSASGTFNVSGTDMLAGILVTAPSGFEVSTDNTTFTNTVTVGATGIIASTPVYIRLKGNILAGSYLGDVALSSAGATTVNYAIVSSTVNKAALTITAADKTKTYGVANPALTVNYVGFVNGDTVTSLTTAASSITTATTASGVGTYLIIPSGAVSSNYEFTYVNGNLTVTAGSLTFTADDKTRTYGAANPVFTGTYDGFVNGDTESSITTPPVYSTIADAASVIGDYPIIPSGAVSPNYVINYVYGNLTVTKATLTVTAENKTKIYGSANPPLTATYSGFVNSQTETDLLTLATITTTGVTASAVGTYPIVASGAADPNYTFSYVDGNLEVTKAILTVTADNKTKVYGAVNPTLTATYSGFVNNETESDLLTLATITTTGITASAVGTYPIVASGAADPNYTFSYVDGNLEVTKASLNITAENKTKVYGSANPTLTVTYSAFANGDTVASLTTPPTITTSADETSAVGTYLIIPSGAASSNYDFTYVNGNLEVTKASLTITAENKTKVYGAVNPTLTVTYSAFSNGDTVASLTTPPTITTAADETSAVGTYLIIPSGAVSPNYDFTYVNGNLEVTKASLTITAENKTKVYGSANPTLTVTYSAFANGDTVASLTTPPTITTAADETSAVGTYLIIPSGAVSSNYDFTYVNGNLEITKASLTITAENKTKVYGSANPTLTVTYSAFANGDTVASLTTPPTITTAADETSAVGTYLIIPSGAVSSNYDFTYVNGNLEVTKASLTITAENKTKVYGSANPTLTVTYSAFANGDTVASLTTQPTITTAADETSSVGTYLIIPSAAASSNYDFTYVNGNLEVTKASLTITAENKTKVYGSANPTLTVTYSAFANGDTVASLTTQPTITTAADETSAVGTYLIIPSGAASSNYDFTYVNGNLEVTKASLTITAENKTKVYGSVNPTLTVTYSAFANGDTVASLTTPPTITTSADETSSVGTYLIIPSGAASSNYDFTYVNGNLEVIKASLTITAENKTKVYGSVNPTLTVTYSAFANGDTVASLTTPPTITTAADETSAVGTYLIIPSGAVSPNYDFTYVNGNLEVTKAIITVTADDKTKVYGSVNPPLTATYSGFVNSQTEPDLLTLASITTTADINSPVGTYPITANGAAATNYSFTYVPGILTVTALTDATLSNLTISEGTLTPVFAAGTTNYTADVANATTSLRLTPTTTDATATVSVNGTVVSSGTASGVINLTVGQNIITTVVTAQDGTTIETYTVTVTRTAAPAIVTAGTLAALSTTYGSASAPTTFNVSGTDMLAGIFVTAPSGFEVSTDGTTFTSTVTIGAAGTIVSTPVYIRLKGDIAAANNYSGDVVLTSTSATTVNVPTATSTVNPAILTITANNASRPYGAADPTFTTTPTGFVNGDSVSIITTQASAISNTTATSPVGNTYIITPSGAVLSSSNYSISYVNGNLEITTATLTITADNKTKIYGEANPPFTFTYTGFVNGDTDADLATLPVGATTADATSPVGIYPITTSGATSSNYTIGYTASATLAITPANLAIAADDKTKIYGEVNPAFTFTYTGFVNGDTEADLTTLPVGVTIADTSSPVGIYPITINGATSSNYTIGYTAGATLSITPANLAIKADDKTKIYGDANPSFTFTYTGFVNGDTVNSLTTSPVGATTADATSPVGIYPITTSGATSNNYTISYTIGAILAITPANLAIAADDKTKIYGEANPPFTFTYTGFVNGDTVNSLTTPPVGATTADATSPVGIYPITISGATSLNYTIGYTAGATLSITPLNLAIAANDQTKIYGEANPVLTLNYSGFVNGDTQADLLTPAVASTIADATSPVGVYSITISGATSNNYTIGYTAGAILTVTPATLTVTANNQTRDFGEANPILTAGYTGFVNGDTVASITTLATVTTTANTTSPPGTYPITASGALATNYIFSYVTGILTVMPLTDATLSNLTISEGTLTPVFASGTTSYTVEVSNAIASVTITPVTNDPDTTVTINGVPVISGNVSGAIPLAVGSNTITVIVTAQDGTTTETYIITVNRTAPPTIVATGTFAALSTTYGSASASNTFNVSGTDMLSGILVTAPSGFEVSTDGVTFTNSLTVGVAGTIASTPVYIRLNGTIPAGNYSGDIVLTSTSATTVNLPIVTSTVNPALLTITAIDATRLYGAVDPTFSTSVAGFVNGDTNAIITNAATVTSNATITSPTGNYALTPSGAVLSSSNYTIVYVNGNLTVTSAILTITADAQTKTYGAANPTLTASYSGFVNGDTATSLTTVPTITTVATTTSSVGNYIITASGAVSSNYTFNYVDGNLAVTPAALIITAGNQTKVYGSPNPIFTSTYTGFVNGDTASSLTVQPVINTPAVTASPVGTYPITDSGAVNSNYTISYVSGNLTITAAPLTITADNKTRAYGASNPPLTASYAGFVNGETVASLTTPPTISTIANATSPVGVYAITVSGAVDSNYAITYVTGVLTVTSPSDVNLASLTISNGVLTPAFSPNVLSYNANVSSAINTETITVVADDPLAKITINGNQIVSGSSFTVLSLLRGVNTFTIKVTSEDGLTTKTYVLTITKEGANDASLSNLTISKGVLDPKFKSDITNYDAVVRYDVNSITVTPTATDPGATITVNGIAVASNTASTPITLLPGENIIETVVTAEDGITKEIYAIVVYKGLSPDALVINNILSPNGDGKNDFWVIKDIELFPNNKVTVYDRAGRIVYSKNSYSNEWDGSYGGSPLNNDTYYYLIDLGEDLPKIKGFITMIRD